VKVAVRVRWRNAAGSIAVLVLIAVIAYGLPAIDRLLPAEQRIEPGQRIEIGYNVSVLPPDGARLDVAQTRPRQGILTLRIRDVTLWLRASDYSGTLGDALSQLQEEMERRSDVRVSLSTDWITTGQGIRGLRGTYTASGRRGHYAVFVAYGRRVDVLTRGQRLNSKVSWEDIEGCIQSIFFGSGM
jgi:hypothetical protein